MSAKRKVPQANVISKNTKLSDNIYINYNIPNDILFSISLFVDRESLHNCRLVSKQWKSVLDSKSFWMKRLPDGLWKFWRKTVVQLRNQMLSGECMFLCKLNC